MSITQELEILIRARYPILYILSPEEGRVLSALGEIAARRHKKLWEWTSTLGLLPGGTSLQLSKVRNAATRDPLAALDHVIEQAEPGIFVFKDLHPFLTSKDPAVIRRLREVATALKSSPKTLVLLSPALELPIDLDKEVALVHFPLPGRPEMADLLDRIVADLRPVKQVEVDLDDLAREKLVGAVLGLTLSEAENVFARIVVSEGRLSGESAARAVMEKRQIVRKSGLLEYYEASEGMADVGGLEHLKEWVRKRSAAFTEEARQFGLAWPRGILLLGVQGCGKSLSAKAISSLWQLPLLRFDIGRLFGSLMGSSEENVRRAIATAESIAPSILWVDEIDKAFAGQRGGGMADGGTSARVLGTFLTWLSEKRSPVFVVATANDISNLPPELLRKGRLDEIFFVDLPGAAERREIFRIHLERRGRGASGYDLGRLAEHSVDFSGSEIEEAINSALFDAFDQKSELSTAHLLEAVGSTVPLSRTMREQLEALRAWSSGRARPANPRSSAGNL
jgi:SpoVK/Ycf46/Vps4 family AAA+-type ATPase